MQHIRDIFEDLASKTLLQVEAADQVELHPDIYAVAAKYGLSLQQYLEVLNPSRDTDTLSAFDRQLKRFGIVTHSDPEKGIWSSPGSYFFQESQPASRVLFPAWVQQQAMWSRLQINDVNELLATTRNITSATYESVQIDDTELVANKGRKFRVSERGQFPTVKISWGETANKVDKHGVAIDGSDEFFRRANLELIGTTIARIMSYDQEGMFNDAISMLLNGDSTAANPAAAVTTAVSLDPVNDANGDISYKAWLKWLATWRPYKPSLIVANIDTLILLLSMARPQADPLQMMALVSAIKTNNIDASVNVRDGLDYFPQVDFRIVDESVMAANLILGLDPSSALERIIEIGSDLKETKRYIENQTEKLVISIADNFSKIWAPATKVLSLINE
jgi:hypothetical protein